jgi:hypothetical protein
LVLELISRQMHMTISTKLRESYLITN